MIQTIFPVLNCVRLLTRILPYIFEDNEWKDFFWSSLPSASTEKEDASSIPLAQSLMNAICVIKSHIFNDLMKFHDEFNFRIFYFVQSLQ